MQIKQFVVGDVATNCYLVWDEKSHEGAIVDPGDCAEQLIQTIQEDHVQLKYILLTHAHFDHILAVGAIQRATGAQVVVSKKDEYLLDANAALSPFGAYGRQLMRRFDFPGADIWAEEGTSVTFGGMTATYYSTPGHTPGSVCYRHEKTLFCGDTLFYQGYGRVDLAGGNSLQMALSLKRLLKLPGDTVCYPGHGMKTKIAWEQEANA